MHTTYRFKYNAHRYQDNSDTPTVRYKRVRAIDEDSAWNCIWAWRETENDKALVCERITHVGMIQLDPVQS